MRIAFLTHQWPGTRMGGIGTYTRQIALALAQAGHDVHIFTLTIPPDLRPALGSFPPTLHFHETLPLAQRTIQGNLPPQSATAIAAGGDAIYRLTIGQLLCSHLLEIHTLTPFDIVETPEVEALGLPLMLLPNFPVPVITHLHCCTAIAYMGNQSPIDLAEKLITSLEFATMHLADRICAPTRAVVDATKLFTNLPAPYVDTTYSFADHHSVHIIPHTYVCSSLPFAPPPIGSEQIMLFIGRIERLKGVATIAAALNEVLPEFPNARFRFLGPDTSSAPTDNPQNPASMRQYLLSILKPEIAARVEFLGEVSHEQIRAELQNCTFCVQPSFWENFSMTCCEAFAAGRTVIVGQNTGSAELVGPAGIIIDPHSPSELATAMKRLLTDNHLLQELSQAAYNRIRKDFSPSTITSQYENFYHQVIDETHTHPRPSLAQRLARLPAEITTPLLPALTNILGSLTQTAIPAHTPGGRLLNLMNLHQQKTGHPTMVLLYGAGKFTTRLLTERHLWATTPHEVIGLIDDHPRFQSQTTYLNLPVQSLEQAIATLVPGPHAPCVVLSTDTYQDQFWSQTAPLRHQGISVYRLYE